MKRYIVKIDPEALGDIQQFTELLRHGWGAATKNAGANGRFLGAAGILFCVAAVMVSQFVIPGTFTISGF